MGQDQRFVNQMKKFDMTLKSTNCEEHANLKTIFPLKFVKTNISNSESKMFMIIDIFKVMENSFDRDVMCSLISIKIDCTY